MTEMRKASLAVSALTPGRAALGLMGLLGWIALLVWVGALTGAFRTSHPDSTEGVMRRIEGGTDLSGLTYRDLRGTAGCTDDCSGHEAGWAWAEERWITDPDECGGRSVSFEEGCRAWAEEQASA